MLNIEEAIRPVGSRDILLCSLTRELLWPVKMAGTDHSTMKSTSGFKSFQQVHARINIESQVSDDDLSVELLMWDMRRTINRPELPPGCTVMHLKFIATGGYYSG